MATPVFDELSVQLALRLGDGAQPGTGSAVTATTDGVAYTAAMRAEYITTAVRTVLNTFGHSFLRDSGYIDSYIKDVAITGDAQAVATDAARILYIDYFGRHALLASFDMMKRRHHTHWQHVPMYRIYDDSGTKKIKCLNFEVYTDVTCYYLKKVPALTSGGSEDVLLGTPVLPLLLATAEVIARRNHQELTTHLQSPLQDAVAALKGA